jgi:preprotein translocase subunit SecE
MKIVEYIRESRDELKKVTWPDKEEVSNFTVIVMVTLVIVAIFLWFIDLLLTELIKVVMK